MDNVLEILSCTNALRINNIIKTKNIKTLNFSNNNNTQIYKGFSFFLKSLQPKELEYLIDKHDAKLILLAIPSASQNRRKEILKKLSKFPIEVKVLPSVDNIVNGEVTIDSIKHVDVEDILGRNKSLFNMRALIKQQLRDENINDIEDIKEDTYSNVELFFSHRRATHLQNLPTGRMINIIGFRNN